MYHVYMITAWLYINFAEIFYFSISVLAISDSYCGIARITLPPRHESNPNIMASNPPGSCCTTGTLHKYVPCCAGIFGTSWNLE
jgi:hypothetical protein